MLAVGSASRVARVVLALTGTAWSLLTLPLVAGFGPFADSALLRSLREVVADPYVVFGALAAASFVAFSIALLPDLWSGGWGGRLLIGLLFTGPLVALGLEVALFVATVPPPSPATLSDDAPAEPG